MSDVYFVYLLANEDQDAFYAGITRDLAFAVSSHRQGLADARTKRQKIHQLVWYRTLGDLLNALRQKANLVELSDPSKRLLVELDNPNWRDLMEEEDALLIA